MAEPNAIGLISSMIAILKGATKDYNTVSNEKSLREAFHEAGRGLLLVEKALKTAETQLVGRDVVEKSQRAIDSLAACGTKAKLSQSIFKDVAQTAETSRFETYRETVRRLGKENRVEVLVTGMMKDICDMAEDSVTEAAMQTQVLALRNAIDKLSKMEPPLPIEQSGDVYCNSGSGSQFNAPRGTQNNNTGSGNQFPGATFSGTLHFGNSPS